VVDSRQGFQFIFLLGFLKTACMGWEAGDGSVGWEAGDGSVGWEAGDGSVGWEAGDGSVEIESKFFIRHTITYLLLFQVNKNKLVIVTEKKCEYFNTPEYVAV
jgi:hypothetical protein